MLRVCARRKRKGVLTFVFAVCGVVGMFMVVGMIPGSLYSSRDRDSVFNDYDLGNYELTDEEPGVQRVQALVRHMNVAKLTETEAEDGKYAERSEERQGRDKLHKTVLPIPVFNYKREEVFPQEVKGRVPLLQKPNQQDDLDDTEYSEEEEEEEDDVDIRNLVIEDNTSDEDDDVEDEDYAYDYNYPENPPFKMSDFDDVGNFTPFQGENNQVAYDTEHKGSQNYGYDDEDEDEGVDRDTKQNPHQRIMASNNNSSVIQRQGVNQPPCRSPGGCSGDGGGQGVNLEPDPGSKATKFSQRGAVHKPGAPTVSAKQVLDKHHKQQNQNPNTSGGHFGEDRRGLRNKGSQDGILVGMQDNGVAVKTQIRTLKRADLNTFMYQNKIETQIPLQDGMDVNILGVHQPATQIQMPQLPWQPGEVRSKQGMPLVVNRIYWSSEVEDLVPKGITDLDIQHFLHKVSIGHVGEMQEPLWNRCGRPKNQYVTLEDGTPLCARYRDPHNKLIQGEVLTFHLAHLLGLDNVPIVVLTEVNSSAPQWRGHKDNIVRAGWQEGQIAAFIQWIDGLEFERSRVRMPSVLLEAYHSGQPLSGRHVSLTDLSADQLAQILQWGDMILLDYITGHYDRVASMQDGADRESRPSIMQESIRNLRQWQTGKLWLIDNESGLFDSYDLMYRGGQTGSRFITFHLQMLKTVCIFHKSFVEKLRELSQLKNPAEALVKYTKAQEPLYKKLRNTSEYGLFQKYFHTRLKEVVSWVDNCRTR